MSENSAAKNKTAKPKKKHFAWLKGIFSELKKVTWPSFPTVLKNTGIVLVVVLAFFVAFFLFDWGIGELYKLLVSGLGDSTSTTGMISNILLTVGRL